MKAVQLSHDHQNLRTVAREFARAHDLRLPRGMEQDRGADRYKERQEVENLPEQQQEERSGITKAERVAAITQAWQETKTGHALAEALRRRGYILARGDRRSFVVVDRAGEIHALARQISGANTRQVKARLADVALDKLPDAHRAQADAHRQLAAERDRAPQPPENRSAVPATPRERRDDLYARQARRRESATAERDALEKQHALETQALAEAQGREIRGVREAREKAKPGPVMAFIARITGFGLIVRGRQKRQDAQRASEHERQREALARRHHREIVSWRHREHGLASVEARERRSLETKIRREAFTRAVGRELAAEGSAGEGLSQQTLPSAQRGRPAPAGDADTMRVTDRSGRGELSRIFNDPLKQPEKARGTGGPEPEASKLSKDFARAVDGSAKTKDDQLARDLLEEFRKRAAGREQQRGARGRDRGRDRDR